MLTHFPQLTDPKYMIPNVLGKGSKKINPETSDFVRSSKTPLPPTATSDTILIFDAHFYPFWRAFCPLLKGQKIKIEVRIGGDPLPPGSDKVRSFGVYFFWTLPLESFHNDAHPKKTKKSKKRKTTCPPTLLCVLWGRLHSFSWVTGGGLCSLPHCSSDNLFSIPRL